jgi:hypothetical protein
LKQHFAVGLGKKDCGMKRANVAFWVFNGLLAAFMALASIPDLLSVPQAIVVFERLGYPLYLLPFIGVAKLLGVAAILFRVPLRAKEWAYAGFAFDSVGALYSHLYVGDSVSQWWGALLGCVLVVAAYSFHLLRHQTIKVTVPA